MESYSYLKKGEQGAWLSIIVYALLSVVKLIIGYIGGSDALMADGLNNTTDIIASIAVLVGLKISRKPPDHNHPYGHLRAESISSLIAAFIMLAVGIEVIIQAALSLTNGEQAAPDLLTAWTALISSGILFTVYRFNIKLSRRITSLSLRAIAYDNRSDALVSIGAFIGIIGSIIGLPWLDTLTALLVGVIICATGFHIFKEAAYTLTDGFDEDKIHKIETTIKNIPSVLYVQDIKGRTHGRLIFIEVTVLVNPNLNVVESHAITEKIESEIKKDYPEVKTLVHIEPYLETDPLN